jgi:nitrate/nitrite-specific signal transduction histidine kinase
VTASSELATDVRSAVRRTARALVSAVTLTELAQGALDEMRDALGLEIAVLYVPRDEDRPVLDRFAVATRSPPHMAAQERLAFDDEAWRLAVQGDAPLVMHDRGEWLMEHPFAPPADAWLVLPLGTGPRRLGAVIGGAKALPAVDTAAAAVLRVLGDLLGAGIAAAQMRQELQRTALERERMRLAAELHDGLAQDLTLAMRELALLDSAPSEAAAAASRERLRSAVSSAHGTVRARLAGIVASPALGGLRPALAELGARFSHRGLSVALVGDDQLPEVSPEVAAVALRVLSEALRNAERHAAASAVTLEARAAHARLELVVTDDGRGFVPGGPPEGHFGLLLMRERALAAGGGLTVESAPGRGTRVALELPLART